MTPKHAVVFGSIVISAAALTLTAPGAPRALGQSKAPEQWKIHDMSRPRPPVITPGSFNCPHRPERPPSDAVVLFDGKNLDAWESVRGGPAPWKVAHGYFEVVPRTGDIRTRQAFGNFQLHIEWEEPYPPSGNGQGRGNSGIFLQGLYELQVLDSYHNPTYADGQCGAIYGDYPPLVNACRPPGRWQTYDIVFHRPLFEAAHRLLQRARVTVFQNGVLIQDNVPILGPTHGGRHPYHYTPARMPLELQDHHNPVRFRNVWIRELKEGGSSIPHGGRTRAATARPHDAQNFRPSANAAPQLLQNMPDLLDRESHLHTRPCCAVHSPSDRFFPRKVLSRSPISSSAIPDLI